MFNDLNNPNNQNRQAVDDIFAETDRTQESPSAAASAVSRPSGGAEIDTQRIGLTATDEFSANVPEKKGQDKLFKIIIIFIVVVVLGLVGYLVYSKFLKAPAETETTVQTNQKTDVSQTAATSVPAAPSAQSGSFVETVSDAATPENDATIPLIPGVNAPETTAPETETATSVPTSLVDSDSDGLTDAEEKTVGTNINIIDTDNDGLSDYEEVQIYHTNPLSADTDGDGYFDGVEVKSGYDPNVVGGKLSGAVSTPKTAPVIK